jgi:hypothetical protein
MERAVSILYIASQDRDDVCSRCMSIGWIIITQMAGPHTALGKYQDYLQGRSPRSRVEKRACSTSSGKIVPAPCLPMRSSTQAIPTMQHRSSASTSGCISRRCIRSMEMERHLDPPALPDALHQLVLLSLPAGVGAAFKFVKSTRQRCGGIFSGHRICMDSRNPALVCKSNYLVRMIYTTLA